VGDVLAKSALLALALSLGACNLPEPRTASLPDWIGVVVQLRDGGQASLLVQLMGPRRPPVLRVAEGVYYFDGESLLEVAGGALASADLDRSLGELLEIRDLLNHEIKHVIRFDPAMKSGGRLLSVDSDAVALDARPDGGEGNWRYDFALGRGSVVAPSAVAPRFEHYGPSRGFEVTVDKRGVVWLRLPSTEDAQALPLMHDASHVLGVSWVTNAEVDERERKKIDEIFKKVGTLLAEARGCEIDGDLSEWADQVAMGVNDRAQVVGGDESWTGERDASFVVATRLNDTRLCWAVRVRDDVVRAGADRLEVVLSNRTYSLVVPETAERGEQGPLRYAYTDSVAFGVAIEGMLPISAVPSQGDFIAFRVIYTDSDDDVARETVLATAPPLPWPAFAGIKKPHRLRVAEPLQP
jgi:hypothetical protein